MGDLSELKKLCWSCGVPDCIQEHAPYGPACSLWCENDLMKASRERNEERAKVVRLTKLTNALTRYAELLRAELNELAPLAWSHGWSSSRVEAGAALRAEIEKLREEA